jgi:hypothetical protein
VTGISHIEYILPVSSYAKDKTLISRREILEVVRKEAAERERVEAIFAGKGTDYQKKIKSEPHFLEGITNSLILAMKKWELLGKVTVDGALPVLQSLKNLGAIDKTDTCGLLQAKTSMYDSIIRSGREKIFEPSNLLLSVRDNSTSSVGAVMKENIGEKIEEISIPKCDGRAYNDYYFVHMKLNTNFRSFDIMRDWGYYFGLLNEYDRVPISVDNGRRILYPQYEVYLTRTICNIYEIAQTIQQLMNGGGVLPTKDLAELLGKNTYSVVSIVFNLKSIGLASYRGGEIILEEQSLKINMYDEETLYQSICSRIKQTGSMLVSDDPSSRGMLNPNVEIRNLDTKHLYLMTDTSWKIEDFEKALREAYLKVTNGKPYRYAYIQSVRKETCRALRIHDDAFDKYLTELITLKPELIELTKASGEITRRLLPRRSFVKIGKPFKFKGKFYRMIMVGV